MGKNKKQATAAIADTDARIALLAEQQAKLGYDLDRATDRAAEQVASGGDFEGGFTARIAERLDVVGRSLALLKQRRQTLAGDVKRAEARDLREEADTKEVELKAVRAKTTKLLAELSRIEGVQYTQSILSAQMAGGWYGDFVPVGPAAHLGPGECTKDPCNPHPYALPLSRKILREIELLRLRADRLDEEAETPEEIAPNMERRRNPDGSFDIFPGPSMVSEMDGVVIR